MNPATVTLPIGLTRLTISFTPRKEEDLTYNQITDVEIAGTGISIFSLLRDLNALDILEAELTIYIDLLEGNSDE